MYIRECCSTLSVKSSHTDDISVYMTCAEGRCSPRLLLSLVYDTSDSITRPLDELGLSVHNMIKELIIYDNLLKIEKRLIFARMTQTYLGINLIL